MPGLREGIEVVSMASQALYTCTCLDDVELFAELGQSGMVVDAAVGDLIRSGDFLMDPRSQPLWPVKRTVEGDFPRLLVQLESMAEEGGYWELATD